MKLSSTSRLILLGTAFVVASLVTGITGLMRTSAPLEAAAGSRIVVGLQGTAMGDSTFVSDYTGDGIDDPATCFGLDIVSLESGQVIGSAVDCLADINGDPESGMNLLATTTFNFADGSFTSRGRTTVQHLLDGDTGLSVVDGFTHATGSPAPADGSSNIIDGSGAYSSAEGAVRLSGLVNLEKLGAGFITFDCVFVIELFDFDGGTTGAVGITPPSTGSGGLLGQTSGSMYLAASLMFMLLAGLTSLRLARRV